MHGWDLDLIWEEGHMSISIYFPTAPTGYNISRLTIGDYNGAVYNVRFSVLNNGNVGIGTQFPTDKLSVFGNIRATEVKVENGNWPDYVFDPLYVPTGLSDLEKISENTSTCQKFLQQMKLRMKVLNWEI
jgi:hypothetical protein